MSSRVAHHDSMRGVHAACGGRLQQQQCGPSDGHKTVIISYTDSFASMAQRNRRSSILCCISLAKLATRSATSSASVARTRMRQLMSARASSIVCKTAAVGNATEICSRGSMSSWTRVSSGAWLSCRAMCRHEGGP